MRNLWAVARHEFRRTVLRRGFLIGTLAVPAGLALLVILAIAVATSNEDRRPIGYVDHAGVLRADRAAADTGPNTPIAVQAFPDETAALAALQAETVQAVFVLPADYLQTLRTDLYYLDRAPGDDAWGDFDGFVRANLAAGLPPEVQARVLAGPQVTVVDLASGRTFSAQNVVNIVLPVAASFLFFITTLSASGYLLRVVADEKENRTIEVMLTAVTPAELIGGKTLGLLAAMLTQLAVYALALALGLLAAGPYVPELGHVEMPWAYLGVMALFFLPTFALLAALMVAVGAALPDLQQGQQVVGLLNLVFMAPIFLVTVLMENPSHPLVLFMTFFPTSAFLTISLRWGLSVVPVWQLAVSWGVLAAATGLAVWAAARVFRLGMLNYGQPLSWKTTWAALRGE